MKLAIGTDDKRTIRHGHFGESQYYSIYEIFNGEIFAQELRENPFAIDKNHVHGQAQNIIDLLNDCQIFIGKSMGKKSLKTIAQKNIDAIVTDIGQIEKAVHFYLISKDEFFRYYDKATGKFCDCRSRA